MRTIPTARSSALARGRVPAIVAAALAFATSTLATPVGAQNVIPNGRFDSDVAGYKAENGATLTHDATIDIGGPSGSGSLKLVNDYGQTPFSAFAQTCITKPLAPGGYYFEYWLRFATGETSNGKAQVVMTTHASSDCSGPPTQLFYKDPIGPVIGRGLWVRFQGGDITKAAATIPAGTNSVRVVTNLSRSAGTAITVNYDAIFLAPVGKPLCGGLVPTIGGKDIDDDIVGTSGADVIVAFGGNDTVHAGGGKDFVCGGGGDDHLYGEGDDDALFGQGGDDHLEGGPGRDVLKGGPGMDTLVGGSGRDICNGGGGAGDQASSTCERVKGAS